MTRIRIRVLCYHFWIKICYNILYYNIYQRFRTDDFISAQENSENTNDFDNENEDVEIVIQIPEDQVEISSAHSNGQA